MRLTTLTHLLLLLLLILALLKLTDLTLCPLFKLRLLLPRQLRAVLLTVVRW